MKEEVVAHYKNKSLDNIDGESWIDVFGYDGIYSVSTLGRIKSEQRVGRSGYLIKERILSQCFMRSNKCKSHVLYVTLYSLTGDKRSYPVHQLVGMSFIGLNSNECFIHKNKEMTDNRLVNIITGTRSLSSKLNYTHNKQYSKPPIYTPVPVKKYTRLIDNKSFIGGNELKIEYGKDVRPNIDSGIKNNKKRYGSFWVSELIIN